MESWSQRWRRPRGPVVGAGGLAGVEAELEELLEGVARPVHHLEPDGGRRGDCAAFKPPPHPLLLVTLRSILRIRCAGIPCLSSAQWPIIINKDHVRFLGGRALESYPPPLRRTLNFEVSLAKRRRWSVMMVTANWMSSWMGRNAGGAASCSRAGSMVPGAVVRRWRGHGPHQGIDGEPCVLHTLHGPHPPHRRTTGSRPPTRGGGVSGGSMT